MDRQIAQFREKERNHDRDPEDAVKMVQYNPLYAAYMPCRIALVEDSDKKLWLTMINLDFLIENAHVYGSHSPFEWAWLKTV